MESQEGQGGKAEISQLLQIYRQPVFQLGSRPGGSARANNGTLTKQSFSRPQQMAGPGGHTRREVPRLCSLEEYPGAPTIIT